MKKLDEIMELMADEMQDFQEGLLQLKKMTDELQSRSIPISTEVMEKHLNFFFQQQQEKEALVAERFNAIDEKLKRAYILPKSLGIIAGGILILLISLIGYLTFELKETKNGKFEVDQIGKKKGTEVNDRNFF
ncbi:hypothetical protein GCM10007103_25590 [Salinimicrobium marinum]|uniref:Uncharacterized protein n=1 Tax=Salinimicrobium marinum TaxID=680283 RepID=A0A918SJB8_9FLAO|nr:DUF6730 family protein [Salinimicrobium marinum]GHA43202.1 hypothetical protein GCM10007103_25590 [Salinimicrobium marinum]